MAKTGTYSVKFMSGALQGEWMRGQTFRQVVRLFNSLAEITDNSVSSLYKSAFIKDENGYPTVFTYKGECKGHDKPRYIAVLYIVSEYED